MATDPPRRPLISVFLPQTVMSFDVIVQRVQAAEGFGFDAVWFIDHFAVPRANHLELMEGWTLAAAVAARTERIRLGHMVSCASFRPPALLAKMIATIDQISGGRFDLGIGWGSAPEELDQFGLGFEPPARRAARMRETLDILRLMFTGEPFDYEGKLYTLRGALGRPRPVNGRVPVHIGGAGPKLTMPLVREYADWWNCPYSSIGRLAELLPERGGVRVSIQHPIAIAPSAAKREEVLALARRRFGSWDGTLGGTPDEVAAGIQAELNLGVEMLVLQFHDFGQPESFQLFAEEVLPQLRLPDRPDAGV